MPDSDSKKYFDGLGPKRTRVQAFIASILYVGVGLGLWILTAKLCFFVMSLQKF